MNRNNEQNKSHNARPAQEVSGDFDIARSANMLINSIGNMVTAPSDIRNVSDDRIQPPQRSRHADFETTADGNVLIVQPSFDDTCKATQYPKDPAEYQDRCPPQEGKEESHEPRNTSPPSPAGLVKDKSRRHTRDLSAHFFDATTLTRDNSNDSTDLFHDGPGAIDKRKHRRMMSGDVTNPSLAHRRLNSIGNSASVQRHHREPSGGLDILSAAADFSREEARANVAQNSRSHPLDQDVPYTRLPQMQRPYPPVAHHMPPPQARRYSCAPEGVFPDYGYVSNHPAYPVYGRPDMYPYPTQYPTQHSLNPAIQKPTSRSHDSQQVAHLDSVRSSNTQGSQTFVTAMAVGGNKTIRPNVPPVAPRDLVPSQISQHHRRMSSFSSLGIGTVFGGANNAVTSPDREPSHPLKDSQSHHRSTSSSVSFLNALDVAGMDGNADDTFLRNLQESTSAYGSAFCKPVEEVPSSSSPPSSVSDSDQPKQLASGGTSKRIRRKCTVAGCTNRVVQGGLCISHGAKRKTCNHPGCTKNVKKAGLCSTHGPARKRCETPGCPKVAVQGGRCIAHGAKKKLCSHKDCQKQAILSGMCKKHHDQAKEKKPSHARGLSIFHDISADAVQSIINADTVSTSPTTAWQR